MEKSSHFFSQILFLALIAEYSYKDSLFRKFVFFSYLIIAKKVERKKKSKNHTLSKIEVSTKDAKSTTIMLCQHKLAEIGGARYCKR